MKKDDLISRAAAIEQIKRMPYWFTPDGYCTLSYDDIEAAINNASTVDAVPVIRCRDCKHSIENAKHIDVACERSYDPDFYCAAGERKDSE